MKLHIRTGEQRQPWKHSSEKLNVGSSSSTTCSTKMIELPFNPEQLNFIISSLDDEDRPKIKSHLLRMNHEDRYLRFFATLGDSAIDHYAMKIIDLKHGKAFGIITIPDRKLIGLAHVSRIEVGEHRISAEIGISVDSEYRSKGLSKRLMDRALVYCRSNGVNTIYMSCLRENKRVQAVARAAGLKVVVNADEAVAQLELNPGERAANISHEIAYEQISLFDKAYRHNQTMMNAVFNV